MGDDTLYSGTVAAATEAYLMGIPAIAFSLCSHQFNKYYATAEYAVWSILTHLIKQPPKEPILWNINIPAIDKHLLQGHKITRLGRRHHIQSIVASSNPRGESIYWIGPAGEVADNDQDTDFAATDAGFISITPLQIDLTAYSQLNQLRNYWQHMTLIDAA